MTWTDTAPDREGKYWVSYGSGCMVIDFDGVDKITWGDQEVWSFGGTKSIRFGPRIPGPAEIEALEAAVAASRVLIHYVPATEGGCAFLELLDALDAARSKPEGGA